MRLAQSKPCHTDDDVEAPLFSPGVLECPHSITIDVPEGARGGVHTTLAGVGDSTVRRGGLIDQALLNDGAVDGEAVWR